MTTTELTEALPRWNLDTIFPGPESPALRAALDDEARAIADLEALFDRHGIGTAPPESVDEALVAAFDEVVGRYNALLEAAFRIDGYLSCLVAEDVRDEAASAAASEWRQIKAGMARLAPRFTAWIGQIDIEALAARSKVATAHLPTLRRIRTAARHLMPAGEEALAAALAPSGASAWMRLRDDLAGRATVRIALDGEEQELPLSDAGNLRYHADRSVRQRAHEALAAAWREIGVPLAAALNGVKGEQLALSRRRGWGDPLDQALFDNAIDRQILDAMFTAIREAFPDYQRRLRIKARLLGLPALAEYDLDAPVGEAMPWPYATSRRFIVETFSAASPKLGALAERAFVEGWIDAEPREGKDAGGFSTGVGGDESRIFLNYLPVYDQMGVLAHELGHSYQNVAVHERGRTPLQAPPDDVPSPLGFPMTLAETASTICEALVQRAARERATPAQEIAILDGWLQSFSSLVFGIYARFILEREVFARRAERELSPSELEAIMRGAWQEVAGDAIDPATISGSDWTKPHFFLDTLWYYNFPYAFGVLFAIRLLAARDANPDGFNERFDGLLADSGMTDAAELAARFGLDLRAPAFWRTSLDAYRADVARYEALAEGEG